MENNIYNYVNYKERLYECRKLYEMSISPEKKELISRYRNSGNISGMMKELNLIIEDIKSSLIEMDYVDINCDFLKKENVYIFNYDMKSSAYIRRLQDEMESIDKDFRKKINDRIFGDGYKKFYLEIEVNENRLNKMDIINGLPNMIKGIGLGKKIYKKLIKELGFISSLNSRNASDDSSMVWNSLANDKDLYTFCNDNNIICFFNTVDYDLVLQKLKEFYNIKGHMTIDDDFLTKYNIKEEDFIKLL